MRAVFQSPLGVCKLRNMKAGEQERLSVEEFQSPLGVSKVRNPDSARCCRKGNLFQGFNPLSG